MRRDAAGFLVASVDGKVCVSCGQCLASCPGRSENACDDVRAVSRGGFLAHATSAELRLQGQSGGVVSALVEHLLSTHRVDGAILTRFNAVTRRAESFCARTIEEARTAVGSCYCQSPVVATALAHRAERLVVVALGCQANALARLRASGLLSDKTIVLGLVCAGNYSGDYIDRLAELAGMRPECVKMFRFRDKIRHGWPGEVSISDGSQTVYLPAKTRAQLKSVYEVPACLNCLDKLNTSADIVFGDPWGLDDRDRRDGDSVGIVRTERGAKLILEIRETGAVDLEEVPVEAITKGQKTADLRVKMHKPWFSQQRAFAQSIQAKTSRMGVRDLRAWLEGRSREDGVRRILTYGFKLSENFGGPSVVHGFRAGLRQLFPNAQMVCYQPTPVDPVSVSDVDFPVVEYPYARKVRRFLKDWMRLKFLKRFPSDPVCRRFWRDYRQADTVVNVYAICFCGNWGTKAFSSTRNRSCLKYMLQQFLPNFVARIDGKRSVKSTASFGPLNSEALRKVARWSMQWCFARVVAREDESRRQLVCDAGVSREVRVAPDLANVMPVVGERMRRNCVALVTSFQIERKWNGPDKGYLACMVALIGHIRTLGCDVLLVPNQINGPDGRGDIEVAMDLLRALPCQEGVSVFDIKRNSGLALKRILAECEVVVSPRYHACVAALSSGVPLLTLGWHYKYGELLDLYGQSRYALPTETCSEERLLATFRDLWRSRDSVRDELAKRIPEVREQVLDSLKYMLGDV